MRKFMLPIAAAVFASTPCLAYDRQPTKWIEASHGVEVIHGSAELIAVAKPTIAPVAVVNHSRSRVAKPMRSRTGGGKSSSSNASKRKH